MDWTGPDQEWRRAYTDCKDWNRTGIHKNQTVLYEDGVYVMLRRLGGILHLQAQAIQVRILPTLNADLRSSRAVRGSLADARCRNVRNQGSRLRLIPCSGIKTLLSHVISRYFPRYSSFML